MSFLEKIQMATVGILVFLISVTVGYYWAYSPNIWGVDMVKTFSPVYAGLFAWMIVLGAFTDPKKK